jgi:hypothetical protein
MNFADSLNQLSHESIISKINSIGKITDDIIYKNYFRLLEFVQRNISRRDSIDLIGISHMVYGWMPTMFDTTDEKIIEDAQIISTLWENILSGSLDDNFLKKIKCITNNSISGGSKLLHFINPNKYAIFDSNVFKSITNKRSYHYHFNIENYKLYMKNLKQLSIDDKKMDDIKNVFKRNNEYDNRITNLRFIEMCLFYYGRLKNPV